MSDAALAGLVLAVLGSAYFTVLLGLCVLGGAAEEYRRNRRDGWGGGR